MNEIPQRYNSEMHGIVLYILNVQFFIQFKYRNLINNFFLVIFFFRYRRKREWTRYQPIWLFKAGAALECSFPPSDEEILN